MRSFEDGDTLTIEPWRASAFPVIKDLVVDRGAFDKVIAAGGFRLGADGQRARRQRHPGAEGGRRPGDGRGQCIGLRGLRRRLPQRFGHAVHVRQGRAPRPLPQGQPERDARVLKMVAAMDEAGFGTCTNHGECEAACPKEDPAGVSSRA
jgi:succinate dehydrogenase / fumarate reductase iron-sulfur subunit